MQPQRRPERGPLRSPLVAHISWLPAGALLSAHLAFSAYGDRRLVPAVALAVVTVVAFFIGVVVHAAAHLVAARLILHRWIATRVFIFGDVPEEHAGDRIVIAAAGPVSSGLVGGALMLGAFSAQGTAADLLLTAGIANLALAALNLLPGLPLDGGRVVVALTRSSVAAIRAGRVIGVIAMIVGTWLLLGGPLALDDTALGLWLVLSGIFIITNAKRSLPETPAPPKTEIENETAGAWARSFAGRVDADDAVPSEAGPYAVSDRGRLAGVLTTDAPAGARAGDVMVPWNSSLGIRANAPLVRALERLADGTAPVVVIVDEKGIVRGIVDETAVRARLASV